jgi:molybdopterin/thiamine biosynthesis adenylyltransferase
MSKHAGLFVPTRLVFIGIGGIGSWLVEPAIRYFGGKCKDVSLVDGDVLEARNLGRQSFEEDSVRASKVDAMYHRLSRLFPTHRFSAHPWFVTDSNVEEYVVHGSAVFLSPDNHTVRRLVSAQAKKLENIVVFTAGNELYDGSCHVYVKMGGIELTKDFITRHPEAKDQDTQETSGCTDLIDLGNVQLIAVNFLMAALVMLAVHQVFKFGRFKDQKEAYVELPQEIYGSLAGRARASMAPRQQRKEEQPCTS